MPGIVEIQQAILAFPEDEFTQLREWPAELDWGRWDGEIEVDSDNGRLDFLIEEAGRTDTLRSLDDL